MIMSSAADFGPGNPPSILGETRRRIRASGRIRTGIMVPNKAFKADQRVMDLYLKGVRKGVKFNELNFHIKNQLQLNKLPLVPKNVSFFTIRRPDFSNPAHAEHILECHGDESGKIFRLPVRFPMDQWLSVLPHELSVFHGRNKLYWSDYTTEGARVCMQKSQAHVDPKSRRVHRSFSGRPVEVRCNCDPDRCVEYQNEECSLGGNLLFYVPGVPSLLQMHTGSFNGLDQMRTEMEIVAGIFQRYTGAPHLSGLIDGAPFFHLSKSQINTNPVDRDTGRDQRTKQWIPVLEADTDLLESALSQRVSVALTNGNAAVAALEGGAVTPMIPKDLQRGLDALDLSFEQFDIYARERFGDNWLSTPQDAIADLNRGADDPDTYRNTVTKPF